MITVTTIGDDNITTIHDGDGGLYGDDYNPQHPACPLFSFGGVEGNSLDDAAAEME